VDVPEKLPLCNFDKDALTQILVNLIDNAAKYGCDGEATEVRIEAECTDDKVLLRVLDRGPGVPRGERNRIFQEFHRGSNAAPGGGSGLGLALVSHYVSAHGGTLEVGDRVGGGAVFSFTLPRA
jgi:signal transduction histidine kinase